jgi:isopentenyl diphosphate isomerase/L-lactate dehydrogenase-like FMN-dependent dehydrogenase
MPLWGLAAGGREGAQTVLELMREELEISLHLCGCRTLDEVDAAVLATIASP